MATSLLKQFRDLDSATKDALADLDSPLLLSFAALSLADEKGAEFRLSAEHIVACLEAAGVAVNKTSVSRALARAGGRVSVSKGLEGEALYRLMTKGEREIAPHLGGGGLSVIRFDGSAPRTARVRLGEVLSKLRGLVRICDPYYGLRTLDSLDHLPVSAEVRFLTKRTNESARKVKGAFRDFIKEHPTSEFRTVPSATNLHDRYVLASGKLLLVGHGLKDIGTKESFMVQVDKELGTDMIVQTRRSFDERWKMATPLKF